MSSLRQLAVFAMNAYALDPNTIKHGCSIHLSVCRPFLWAHILVVSAVRVSLCAVSAAMCVSVVDPCVVDDGDVAISVDLNFFCAHTDRTRAKATVRAIADRRAFSLKEPGPWSKLIQQHVNV